MEPVTQIDELRSIYQQLNQSRDGKQPVIRVCMGPGCLAQGADKVAAAFRKACKAKDLAISVEPLIKETGCHGFCKIGPLVSIDPGELFYTGVKPEDVPEIIEKTLIGGEVLERLLYSENGDRYTQASAIPFYKLQQKIATRNLGIIDPVLLEDALARGAYQAAGRALTSMTPDEVIKEVEASGLRGRGGAGFPTGRKWRSAVSALKKSPGLAYVVCNGDEGDPGAFMDRAIMEGDPHAVLEGMLIGAYAIGANQGFLYVRAEYPIAIKNLARAIDQARALGMIGKNILGTGFDFDVQINRGAGAFVCGESTALFTSIEGRAGEPRAKYIRSVERGLWNRPTVLNNVESWANIPVIIEKGGSWYAQIGPANSTGTKAFSLVGKVKNVGLIEVPMGVSLSRIVEEIGGGVPGGKPFKAVQTGGPSGGCIPYQLKDVAVDYDSLIRIGSMMGSGGMIVMDDTDCVVDVARYFLRFLEDESCGKCLPCRLGLKGMLDFLERFSRGEGTVEEIDELESLAQAIQDGSLCALGGSAPNPVLTTLRYFRDEYVAHIVDKKCPAGVCKALITYRIDPEACTGCGLCVRNCPQSCITGEKKKPHQIDQAACIRCGMCLDSCKFDAVKVA
ncbi:MAG: NADH-quinone oxidoreductase subunit NuoF [Desulfobacterota bacterium]|nr:NADH-quinone oxidoreductase subunit NuoF [Thermodesulfobacteriota bacterium]